MSEVGKESKINTSSKQSRKIKWIVGGVLLVLAVFIVKSLPRGYNDDLSLIGKGKAAVVLIRDKDIVQSFELLNVMDNVRDQYAGKVIFLLTDFDTPQGEAFIQANHAARATLVLLDSNGGLVKVLTAPQTAESLQQELAATLGEK